VGRGLTFRIVTAYGVLLAVLVTAFVALAVAVTRLQSAGGSETHSAEVLSTANALEKTTLDLETGLRGFLLAGSQRFLAPYRAAQSEYPVLAARLETVTAGTGAQHARAVAIAAAVHDYAHGWAAPLIARAGTNLRAARLAEASGGGKRRVDGIRDRFAVFDGVQQRVQAQKSSDARTLGTLGLWLAIGSLVFCALVLIGFAIVLRRTIVEPIRALAHAVARVSRGELSVRVPRRGAAEVGELTAGFNAMTESLERVEKQRDVQHAVARVLADAASTEEALPRVLAAVCAGLDWRLGFWWQRGRDGDLHLEATHAEPGHEDEARRRSETEREPAADGAIAVPVAGLDGDLLGVAEFFGREDLSPDGLLETLRSIAVQTAQFIERKRAESSAEEMRQEFVATVSHELRTPLTSIDGWLQVVLDEDAGALTDDQRRFLETAKRNSDRLTRLVGDLLVARQIETGTLAVELEELDVADVLREALEEVAAAAAKKQLELNGVLDEPAVVRGDRTRLLQLFDNLLSNAVKFTPQGGRIDVALAAGETDCTVAVSDTGIGIPPDERAHLFERFYRASSATAHAIGGTGLGLSISKAIAQAHGGTIELADRAEPGTTFVVELPLAVQAEARVHTSPSRPSPSRT
jgi:signal transduction histidine kinase/CHASE3 domain sensor protein